MRSLITLKGRYVLTLSGSPQAPQNHMNVRRVSPEPTSFPRGWGLRALILSACFMLISCSAEEDFGPDYFVRVSGVVRNPTAPGFRSAFVVLIPNARFAEMLHTTSDATGSFTFGLIEPGNCVLTVRAQSPRGEVAIQPVRIFLPRELSIPVELERPCTIVGRATLSGTSHHEGSQVVVPGAFGAWGTDSSGSFRISGLPHGLRMLRIMHFGYHGQAVPVWLPTPGCTVRVRDLQLSNGR